MTLLAPEQSRSAEALTRYELVLVAYRSREPLARLLARIPARVPVVVVDNSRASEDLHDLLARFSNVRYLDSGGNVGFGAACNLGAQFATRPYIIFLNPDTEPDPELFEHLIESLEADPACSSCGPALIHENGANQLGAGGWQPTLPRAFIHALALDRIFPDGGIWFRGGGSTRMMVEWIAGTCLAIRRELFLEVGGFDPMYFLYQEDMDLGRRLKVRGYCQLLHTDLRLRHARGGSSPSSEAKTLWTLRGRMLSAFLHRHHTMARARLLRALLAGGYLARAVAYAVTLKGSRAAEMWCYTRILCSRSGNASAPHSQYTSTYAQTVDHSPSHPAH